MLFLTTLMDSLVSNGSSSFKDWNTSHEVLIMAPATLAITELIINEFRLTHFRQITYPTVIRGSDLTIAHSYRKT